MSIAEDEVAGFTATTLDANTNIGLILLYFDLTLILL